MGRSLHNKIYLGRRFPLLNVERLTVAASSFAAAAVLLGAFKVFF